MGKRTRPTHVCWDCVEMSGKPQFTGKLTDQDITEGICDLCKNKALLVPVKALGFFTDEELARVRSGIDKQGLKHCDGLKPKSVEKALMIVEGVLGEQMSYWTRKVWKGIKDDFEKGKKIHQYDLNKLMFWFAKDVAMRKEKPDDIRTGDEESPTDELQ